MKYLNQKGFAIVTVLMMFTIAFLGLYSLSKLGGTSLRTQNLKIKSAQAFYLAEAAVNKAKADLVGNFFSDPLANEGVVYSLGDGEYSYTVGAMDANYVRIITGVGAIPDFTDTEATRSISVGVQATMTTMSISFDNAIYAADDVEINGKPHTVTGDVVAGDEIDCAPSCSGISGGQTAYDDDDYVLPVVDLESLRAIAISQGNYYSEDDIASNGSLPGAPTTFYYDPPAGTSLGTPNIVFVEGDLSIGGRDTVGGLVVVVGDYMTNPSWDSSGVGNGDVDINGNGSVDGFIYALDDVTKNGGGGGVAVDGGIIAWDKTILNGKLTVNHNPTYATTLSSYEVPSGSVFDTVSWNDKG